MKRSASPAPPLQPDELATGAVMAALAIAFAVVGAVVPVAGALQIVAIVPLAVIAQRHRIRALVTAGTAAVVVSFIAAGFSTAIAVIVSAVVGGIIGNTLRRGGGLFRVLWLSTLAGVVLGALSTGLLVVLSGLRELFLTVSDNSVRGLMEIIARFPPAADGALAVADWFTGILEYWWAIVFGSAVFSTIFSAIIAWFVLRAILARLSGLDAGAPMLARSEVSSEPPAPLPLRMQNVTYTYAGARRPALTGVDLTVHVGEFVAVVGANGSGKSTLARLLAGAPPTSGTVDRPGSAGLGQRGGTAMVLQHPETQVLGTRVADDVVWGLPAQDRPGVDRINHLLADVGLAGFGHRDTGSLSGGEMQRLAVAAALAREPALLVADEATTMIDPAGQIELVDLLASLPRRYPMSVVLVTHRATEAARADRVLRLDQGRPVMYDTSWMSAVATADPGPSNIGPPVLELRGVGYVYSHKSPWATRALDSIDLTVRRGEGLVIVGVNGSGKSTLAWIMAGLVKPTEGTCEIGGQAGGRSEFGGQAGGRSELGGRAVSSSVGAVGLSFQHARLQLQRRTVAEDLAAAGGSEVGSLQVAYALDSVGLDRRLAGARIDELSGGQMRRVVLAGLLIGKPSVVVLDEPLAGLDPPGRREVIDLLARMRRSGTTLVVISHDPDSMDSVRTRTVRLERGRIVDAVPAGVS